MADEYPPLRVREADGSPNVIPTYEMVFSGATLTRTGPTTVQVLLDSGGGGSISVPLVVASGGTGSTAFDGNAVIFSSGGALRANSMNLLWNNSTNRLEVRGVSQYGVVLAAGNGGGNTIDGTSSGTINTTLWLQTVAGTDCYICPNAGNLGVGQTSPVTKLEVVGTTRTTQLAVLSVASASLLIGGSAGSVFGLSTGGAGTYLISSSGTSTGYAFVNSAGGGGLSTVTFRDGHTFSVAGKIRIAVGQQDFIPPYFVTIASSVTAKIVKARYVINSGAGLTVNLQQNGVNILQGLSVSTVSAESTGSVTIANNDSIGLVVNSTSGPAYNMTVTVVEEHTA